MNRRNFLKANAAITAGLLLPKAVLSQSESCSKSSYSGKRKASDNVGVWYFTGKLCEKIKANFNGALQDEKIFELHVRYYKNGVAKDPVQKGKYYFAISSLKINKESKTAIAKAKYLSRDKNGYALPKKIFNKKRITLTLSSTASKSNIQIESKKGVLTTIARTTSKSSGKSGCYLTTACVNHQGLADDCNQLNTLRELRDQFMSNTAEGKKLIHDYDFFAPTLVEKINSFENHQEIYNYMFSQMITPSVALIKNEKQDEAILLYKKFTTALYQEYMNQ